MFLSLLLSFFDQPPVLVMVFVVGIVICIDLSVFRVLQTCFPELSDFLVEEVAREALREEELVILTVSTESL